jgi:hypothetical protein
LARLEFTKKVYMEIMRRAGFPDLVKCEGCGKILKRGEWEVHHLVEEKLLDHIERTARKKLTAQDGKCLGKECCHKRETAEFASERARSEEIVLRHAGYYDGKPKSRPILGSKTSGYKRKMDGTIVKRSK